MASQTEIFDWISKPAYCPPPAPDLSIMVRIHPTKTQKHKIILFCCNDYFFLSCFAVIIVVCIVLWLCYVLSCCVFVWSVVLGVFFVVLLLSLCSKSFCCDACLFYCSVIMSPPPPFSI